MWFRSGLRKRNSQLDEVLKQVEDSCQHITFAVRDLVDLTEAVRMYLATKYQCGPLAGLREKMRRARGQVRVTMNSSKEEGPWTHKNLLTLGTYHQHSAEKTRSDLLDQMAVVSEITLLC